METAAPLLVSLDAPHEHVCIHVEAYGLDLLVYPAFQVAIYRDPESGELLSAILFAEA